MNFCYFDTWIFPNLYKASVCLSFSLVGKVQFKYFEWIMINIICIGISRCLLNCCFSLWCLKWVVITAIDCACNYQMICKNLTVCKTKAYIVYCVFLLDLHFCEWRLLNNVNVSTASLRSLTLYNWFIFSSSAAIYINVSRTPVEFYPNIFEMLMSIVFNMKI